MSYPRSAPTLLALVATADAAARVATLEHRPAATTASHRATTVVAALAGALAWVHIQMPDFIMRTEAQGTGVYLTMALAVGAVFAVARAVSKVADALAKQSSPVANVSG